ncbi:non-oxidative hydroxyarylic acid decarboxylases subunit C [Enterobacillus tribolii]|uniref:UbiD family decarboxylase n=1 Tax=Enterobacillus tribolii TaxID=1487935 RepID=A0A370QUK8_9GAMM|nr:non-oxidative hydroxyarylic acid decarboxylases subunit C [Enterobacillus tribolii]MBW7981018.1 UbiD family decarboxylase [Enterobacillus tribolii]RDK92925.1 UbiD family decarboxylase [Enterobacillus tribolii]
MAFHDLRSFLQALEQQQQLLNIDEPVMPEPDISAAACAATKLGDKSPALLFNNIFGYHDARIAMNVHGSWPNLAIAMGMPKNTPLKQQFLEFVRRYQNYPGEVEYRETALWQEVVIEQDINLFDILPLFRLNHGDGGFYIDKASVVSRDPSVEDNAATQNVGIYRIEVKGRNRLGLQPVPAHDIAIHLQRAEELGVDLPVAITIGNDPMIGTVGAMPILYDQSEYAMAGALNEEPYPVVRTALTGLDVPWGSEYVLEGRIISRYREAEGPFGEFTGHYSGGRRMPVVEITKVSHRRNPVYEHLYLGMPWTEIDYMMGINTCAPLYVQLKEAYPEIEAVNALYTHGLIVIVSTKTRFGGFAKGVGMRVLTTPHGLGYAKMVIVVDETIDPFNLPQVMWAISTKFNPEFDLVTVPGLSILPLDPASEPAGMTTKVIIDATTPKAPETHGHFSQELRDPVTTEQWVEKLQAMIDAGNASR